MKPMVSILVPTYNRARFLPSALEAIAAQTFTDWELVVLADGSTDDTRQLIEAWSPPKGQPVRVHHQDNAGVGTTRDRLVELGQGTYFAFLDSDDLWLPFHLERLVNGFEAHPDLDWGYGMCWRATFDQAPDLAAAQRFVAEHTNPIVEHFPFQKLPHTRSGDWVLIEPGPKAIQLALRQGHFGAMQASMFRPRIFDKARFGDHRVGEDMVFAVRATAAGCRQGFLEDVHVVYREHGDQTSASGSAARVQHRITTQLRFNRAVRSLLDLPWKPGERQTLTRRLADETFWTLGYGLLWEHGQSRQSLYYLMQGLRLDPTDKQKWRTGMGCVARYLLGRSPGPAPVTETPASA